MSRRLTTGLIALLLGISGGLAIPAIRHLREVPPPPPPVVRLALVAPPDAALGFGDDPLDATVSADGQDVVFVATADGTPHLWRRRLGDTSIVRLEGTAGAQMPAWNRRADALAFFAGGRLKTLTPGTGEIREVAEAGAPAGAAWLSDGTLAFSGEPGSPILRVAAGTAQPLTRLKPGDTRHVFPAAGDGDTFVYVALLASGQRMVRVVTPEGERDLGTTSGHAAIAHDRIVHVLDGTLVAEPIARERPRPTNPHPRVPRTVIATGVGISATGRALIAVSPRVLLYAAAAPRRHQLAWLDPDSGTTKEIRDPGEYWRARLSPTDAHAAVTVTEPLLRTLDVIALPTGPLGDMEQVSLALAPDTNPVWSPDGRRIIFRSMQSGIGGLVVRPAHLPEAPLVPVAAAADYTATDWRGRRLLAHAVTGKSGHDLWDLDDTTLTGRAVVATGFNETDGRWSSDGRWVAYVSDESGRPDIYATRLSDGVRRRISFAGGTQPRWAPDGRTLYFLRDGALMRSVLTDGAPPTATAAARVGEWRDIRDFDTAKTSARLLIVRPAARAAEPAVTAALDWATLLVSSPRP